MIILETPVFTRQVLSSESDEEYRELQLALVANPELGPLVPGGGGLRKVRWRAEGPGKRGGYRVIYYWAVDPQIIVMLYMYAKNQMADLTPEQTRLLRRAVEQEFGRHRANWD
ncbi:MAG TPA: type II toxin-antitoxin system RelE/ParE family toxin [Longimicrobium sp.]|nr:type II toxin-antitoxin system RelE/ParE family toxin [Longimicrobium sp.]